jgi:tRNA (adenine22-N1)-methyltransferase
VEETIALQPRLRALADLTPRCETAADIGTDHGYLPAALLLEGKVQRAIAADIGQAPLDRARATAVKYGLEERMDLRLGDGLHVLAPGEADAIVIAGMGGDTIVSILSAAPWARRGPTLLLQPMSHAEVLRDALPGLGLLVTGERLVEDKGVLYPILTATGGEMPPATPAQAWGGFLLGEDPLWGKYLDDRLLRLHRAAAGLAKARDSALERKRAETLAIIRELEKWKGEWQGA